MLEQKLKERCEEEEKRAEQRKKRIELAENKRVERLRLQEEIKRRAEQRQQQEASFIALNTSQVQKPPRIVGKSRAEFSENVEDLQRHKMQNSFLSPKGQNGRLKLLQPSLNTGNIVV